MTLLEPSVLLAGYLMAHSAFNLSFIDEVKVLAPFSLCVKDGAFHTKFHTAPSQSQAISAAKKELMENQNRCTSWALAREGWFEENGRRMSALVVTAWSEGMPYHADYVQQFERTPKFRLIGAPTIAVQGLELTGVALEQARTTLLKGVAKHEDGGRLWESWRQR